jgi:putative membrane protein
MKGRFFASFMVVMGIFGFAAIFELIEWLYAEFSSPASGSAFLGSQGDIWDAQKDMLCDGLGAITTACVYALVKGRKNSCRK